VIETIHIITYPDDDFDKLPLDGYEGIFKLIYDYIMLLNK